MVGKSRYRSAYSAPGPRQQLIEIRPGKRGRPTKWIPSIVSTNDLKEARAFQKRWGVDHTQKERIISFFEKFCEGNDLTADEGIFPCIGQMRLMKLLPGTVLDFITSKYNSSECREAKRACALAHADANTLTHHWLKSGRLYDKCPGVWVTILR